MSVVPEARMSTALAPRIASLVGNPRPESRTHGLARTLAEQIARVLGATGVADVDLAPFGPRVLDPADAAVTAAVGEIIAADLLVVASPTYKAAYTGLLKSFLDRFGNGSLAGTAAVPVLLGGMPDHRLAVDVHFTPLLLELGAAVPTRGLFVLEADVADFGTAASAWADAHAPALLAASRAQPQALATT